MLRVARVAPALRVALAALAGCFVLLAAAPAALAVGGGAISGKVTSAAGSHEALPKIEVTAYEAGSELPVGFATTTAAGEYLIAGLPNGLYKVEFSPGFEGEGGNYIRQFYKDAASSTMATSVPVSGGSTTGEINAELQVGGEIKGTVTEATHSEDIVPLKGMLVTVYRAGGEEAVAFAVTGANGQYTVMGLSTGSYKVGFSAGFEEQEAEPAGSFEGEEILSFKRQNFIAQFYKDAPTLTAANAVPVIQEQDTVGINAELQRGAEIEGTVTDAATHAPIANAFVIAFEVGKVSAGTAFTDANGHYTIVGLPSGSYEVGFAASRHIEQFYDNQPSFASATPVAVVAPNVTGAINAALVPKAPVNTAAPVASGTPSVGQTLSCTSGSWTGSPKPTYAYAWLRDGVPIAGATASTYVVQTADEGNGLTCRVTATNKSGSATAVSNTLIVPVPPLPPPTPVLRLVSAKLLVRHGATRVSIACAKATCAGSIELTARLPAKHRKRGGRHAGQETVVLGKSAYSLAAGHSATVAVRLTASADRALLRAKHRRLSVTVIISVLGGNTVQDTAVLSAVSQRARR